MVRWRRADLARLIAVRFGVVLAERSVGAPGFPAAVRAAPASRPRRGGAGVFRRDFAALVTAALPPEAVGKPVEVWWQMP